MQRSTPAGAPPDIQWRRRRLSWVTAAVAATFWFGLAGQASAQYTTPPPKGGIPVDTQTQPVIQAAGQPAPAGPAQISRPARESAGRQSLPVTGGDVVGLAAMGAGAVVVGGILVAVRRRSAEA